MALPVKLLLLAIAAGALLSVRGASAVGMPSPSSTVNFSIGVQGMVWCKTCNYGGGYSRDMDASPLAGGVAELLCRRGRRTASVRGFTDRNGYFRIESSKMAPYTSTDCSVRVRRSPADACGVVVYPRGGDGAKAGLPLKFDEFVQRGDGLQALYSVGNFFFIPKRPYKCY